MKCTAIKAGRNRKASKTAIGAEDRAELLAKIKADFDARLAAMAAEPARWVEFIDRVATFGARYSLGNQILLLVQAEERGIEPRYFLPYGKRDGSTGWKAHSRYVRAGEKAFKIWAPIRRRPTEEQASEWEAAGRKVAREPSGRPAVQVVGFGLANTFDPSQTDGEPFEPPTAIVRRRILQRGDGPQLLTGDDPTGVFDDLIALIKDQGYTFELTVATLLRGARPSRRKSGEHDFVTPSLPTPAVARPTVWTSSQRSVEEILAATEAFEAGVVRKERSRRVLGVRQLLGWLAGFPGEAWQQRWLASGADTAGKAWTDLPDAHGVASDRRAWRAQMTGAAGRLILLDVIRPSYIWLYSAPSNTLYQRFEQLRDPSGFAVLTARCDANRALTVLDRRSAFTQLARMLMHNGGLLADITVVDCAEAYRAQTGYANARQHSLWYALLRKEGILPADAPPTIFAASRRGQLSIEEIVDGYNVVCRPVRDMFVDYLHKRQPGLDYKTIRSLATKLVLLFWKDLELHHPGIDSLHLDEAISRPWKKRLRHVRYGNHNLGQERQDPYSILMAVRAFYADLSHWALEDPARWAQWAAPSPVDSRDLAGMTKAAKHRQSRIHQRIRELAPLLPRIVDTASEHRSNAAALLSAARQVAPGELFTAAGQTLRRTALAHRPPARRRRTARCHLRHRPGRNPAASEPAP
ncbi:ArdC family protein [Phytohabitans rumicis]|uniref:Uncharacterized protein n=1 Tax=Phytohabitans rumicis TaxID=1076125 RepID=A0A6V8LGW1_9ACTN|nr:ArdC family protein [Phytohabitans rumicis]GFJ93317.1 hypothetical protein Prum_069590 [Phytohabitans rumicis]